MSARHTITISIRFDVDAEEADRLSAVDGWSTFNEAQTPTAGLEALGAWIGDDASGKMLSQFPQWLDARLGLMSIDVSRTYEQSDVF